MAVITVRNLDDEAAVSRETITVVEQPFFMLTMRTCGAVLTRLFTPRHWRRYQATVPGWGATSTQKRSGS